MYVAGGAGQNHHHPGLYFSFSLLSAYSEVLKIEKLANNNEGLHYEYSWNKLIVLVQKAALFYNLFSTYNRCLRSVLGYDKAALWLPSTTQSEIQTLCLGSRPPSCAQLHFQSLPAGELTRVV